MEVGCGRGRFLDDVSPQAMVRWAGPLGQNVEGGRRGAPQHREGPVLALPFQDSVFDLIAANFFPIRALEDPLVWREISRVLTADGTFYYLHWLTMSGPFFPAVQRIVYGARFHRPLGNLVEMASAHFKTEEKLVSDGRGNLLHVLICRKPAR